MNRTTPQQAKMLVRLLQTGFKMHLILNVPERNWLKGKLTSYKKLGKKAPMTRKDEKFLGKLYLRYKQWEPTQVQIAAYGV